MQKFCLSLGLLLAFTSAHAAQNFGRMSLADTAARPLKTAVAEFKDDAKAPILVKGTVRKVCEAEGCWMTLEDQGQSVRVFFKDHSFTVTQKLKDKPALAEGRLLKRVRSVADQKHLLRDAGEPAAVVDAVKEDKVFFELEATGIKAL